MNWREPGREDSQVAVLWAVCAGLAVLFRPLWLAAGPFFPPCPWRALTGWPCPGCGTTRALVRLLHADVPGAISVNPLASCAALAFVIGGLAAPVWLACGGKTLHVSPRPKPAALAALAAVFLANWAWLVARGV